MARGTRPLFGTWYAPDEPVGEYAKRYSELHEWLVEMRMVHGFDAIGYEKPWMNADRDTMHQLRILTGFPVIVECFCGLQKPRIPCREVDARVVKKALTGDSFASKPDMVAAAKRLGWAVKNDDEADAGAVGMVTIESLWPSPT